ncbi:MAG: site-specific integrase [Clostridia bacterium]|jgi:integrase|nr:site-specific integrase [Clostridia bacterium]
MTRRGSNEGSIRKRNDGRYEVRITTGINYETGKPNRASFYAKNKEEAKNILQTQIYKTRVLKINDTGTVTLGQWLKEWLEVYMKNTLKQSTFISYRGYIKNHFAVISNIKLKDLTAKIIQELYNHKFKEEKLSPKTIKNMNNCLHKALSQAQKEGFIFTNPCDAVNTPRSEYKEIEVLSLEEQKKLIRESYNYRYGVFVRLVLSTGLRIGELLGLQWQDINFDSCCIFVKRTLNRLNTYSGETKTEIVLGVPKSKNSIRMIPLSSGALNDLKKWTEVQNKDKETASEAYINSGFVVTNELGNYIEPRTFRDYYRNMLKNAGLKSFTFHALRHTFATRAMERGMDSKTLSVIMGHFSVSFTLDTYAHVLNEHKKEHSTMLLAEEY